ncbi:MAG: HNH endonuclease [Dermatophilus congolensis]|nr:HNH endonuclease [Dermatophilus congolensis]
MKRTVDTVDAMPLASSLGVSSAPSDPLPRAEVDSVAGRLAQVLPVDFGPGNEPLSLVDELDAPGLGLLYRDLESLIAWLRYVQAATVDRIVDEALAEVGRESVELYGPGSNGEVTEFAHSVVSEELMCLTGMSEPEAETRVSFSVTAPAATRRLTEGLRNGSCTWEKARYVHERASGLDSIAADYVADKALAAPRKGEVVSWRTFTDRVRRAVDAATDSETKRHEAKQQRCTWIQLTQHGMADFGITGESARVIAAYERVDATARRLRGDGDSRTLRQLRSDVALDLLLTGQFPIPSSPSEGELPAGRVAITVSLASLVGLTDEPGQTRFGDLPAAVVRDIALREGSTLARIVTDPVDGSVIDASTDSYRPTAAMRRYVTARDRTCRAPGCTVPAERCDLDHGTNWPHGPTAPGNLTAKHRRHHEFKTRRLWRAEQQPDGTVTWKTLCSEYTTYPAGYDTDPDDAREVTETILDRAPATVDELLADMAAEQQAAWRRRWHAYRHEIETCSRVRHDDCPGSSAWADPADPGHDFGTDTTTFINNFSKACRNMAIENALGETDTPTLRPDTAWDRPNVGPPPF